MQRFESSLDTYFEETTLTCQNFLKEHWEIKLRPR